MMSSGGSTLADATHMPLPPKGPDFFVLPLMCIVQNDNLVEKCQNSCVEMNPSSSGRSRTIGVVMYI